MIIENNCLVAQKPPFVNIDRDNFCFLIYPQIFLRYLIIYATVNNLFWSKQNHGLGLGMGMYFDHNN